MTTITIPRGLTYGDLLDVIDSRGELSFRLDPHESYGYAHGALSRFLTDGPDETTPLAMRRTLANLCVGVLDDQRYARLVADAAERRAAVAHAAELQGGAAA